MIKTKNSGFSLLELLVVLAIIGMLAGVISIAMSQARIRGRDAKRAGDMRQMITSLDQYYVQHGIYPTGTASVGGAGVLLSDPAAFDSAEEAMIPNYVPMMPTAPSPADGSCDSGSGRGGNNYWYEAADDGSTYTMTFCLGKGTESWPAGTRFATPEGVK